MIHIFAGEDDGDCLGGMSDYQGSFEAIQALKIIKFYKDGWVEFVVEEKGKLVMIAKWDGRKKRLSAITGEGILLKKTYKDLIASNKF